MSRNMVVGLVVGVLVLLVFSYTAFIVDDSPRAVPATATAGASGSSPGGADPAAGEQIAQAQCFSCHTVDGSTLVGPTWQGLYGSEVPLEDGSTVTADDAYIRESILEPNARIHDGFAPVMPAFEGILDDQQISDVIAYIQTLE